MLGFIHHFLNSKIEHGFKFGDLFKQLNAWESLLNQGFLKFAQKDRAGAYAKKECLITRETLSEFKVQLDALILELLNPEIPFIEKEVWSFLKTIFFIGIPTNQLYGTLSMKKGLSNYP